MIQKVSLYFILPMCILAFFLSLAGVQHIGFGNDYYTFIGNVGETMSKWKIEIPNIPQINKIVESNYDQKGAIIQLLVKIANFFVGFVNVISRILNVVIMIINIVIQLLQFIISMIIQCKDFIGRVSELRNVAYV